MLNMWEEESVRVLALADAIRALGTSCVENEDDAERIGSALQVAAAKVAAIGASLIVLNEHPILARPRSVFGRRG